MLQRAALLLASSAGATLLIPLLASLSGCRGGGEPQATPAPAETLAFIRDGDVWLIDADGSGDRRLTDLGKVQSFAWVSHAELDVVTSDQPPRHLLVEPDGSARELPFPTGGSWSRDGNIYVVLVEQRIVVFQRDGREVARLQIGPPVKDNADRAKGECDLLDFPDVFGDPLFFGPPVFSPDGQRVLVAVGCASRVGARGDLYGSLYEASLNGDVNRRLPLEVNLMFKRSPPRISPDGRRIAQAMLDRFPPCRDEHYLTLADGDGANSRVLTVAAIADLHQQEPRPEIAGGLTGYDWSPSSDAIVAGFDVGLCDDNGPVRPALAALYVLNADGSAEEKLADGPTDFPAWSPSGRLITYVNAERGVSTIRLLDLTARQTTDLARGTASAWQPQP